MRGRAPLHQQIDRRRTRTNRRHTTVALALALCGGAQAHVGTRVFPVYEQPPGSIDLRDGGLGDWEDVAPEASLTMVETGTTRGRPTVGSRRASSLPTRPST